MTYCRWFSSATPRLAPISCSPGSMMSIEIALMDISMAINAMNWTFVSPEMVAAWSMGLVISYILPAAAFLQPVLRHAEPVRGTFRNDLDLLNKLSLLLCRIEKDAVLAGGN